MTDDRTNDTQTARGDLPLPDYDHLPVGTLAHRIRALDATALERVLDYERGHGRRMPVLAVLEQRLEELRGGAQPSSGNPAAPAPEQGAPAAGGSQASPQTQGPPQNPPAHGVPGYSSQPRG